MSSLSNSLLSNPIHPFSPNPNPSPTLPLLHLNVPHYLRHRRLSFSVTFSAAPGGRNVTPASPAADSPELRKYQNVPPDLLRTFAASTILFLGFGIRAFSAAASASAKIPPIADCETLVRQHTIRDDGDAAKPDNVENGEDEDMRAAFESWKLKTYALTVSLRVVALSNSIPPLWIKNFIQSQGKRVKLRLKFCGSLEEIFSELSTAFSNGNIAPKSAVAADIVTLGDTWFSFAINKALIEPIQGVDDQDWFGGLSNKWKVYLRRNSEGKLDSEGRIWAAPYRWGSIVIAYKKRKFKKHKLAPIEDWADLWRPELAGRISMVDSPREVVGAVLKHMGASYNTDDIDSQVAGGKNAVQQKLALLQKQVRVFDSVQYLKAFGVGDTWVAVGWSSDIIPTAKRMTDVAVIVPRSGASLWADLWAVPAASKLKTIRIGGRVRGPSPLVHQWIDFCLQAQRALPFKQEVIPGASPSALESAPVEGSQGLGRNKPKLDTNLIAGVPPPEILEKCEFLEPLSDTALSDYRWLLDSMQKPSPGLIQEVRNYVQLVVQKFSAKVAVRR